MRGAYVNVNAVFWEVIVVSYVSFQATIEHVCLFNLKLQHVFVAQCANRWLFYRVFKDCTCTNLDRIERARESVVQKWGKWFVAAKKWNWRHRNGWWMKIESLDAKEIYFPFIAYILALLFQRSRSHNSHFWLQIHLFLDATFTLWPPRFIEACKKTIRHFTVIERQMQRHFSNL